MICKTNLPNLVAAAQPGYLIESIDLGDNTQEMRIVGDDILASATAVESDVASGKTFFAGTSDIKTGTRTNINSSTIFDGATTILAYKSMSENRFDYTSAGYNLTIDGLSGVATIINNGTKSVGIIVDVTSSTSTAISFTITCTKESEEIVYDSKVFYYGTELGAGNCLAVAETLAGSPKAIGYTFIESATLPVFNLGGGLWNNIYSYQIVAFILGRYVGTSIGSNFLTGCSAFNQPLDLSNITSIGDNFLSYCYSFNQPLDLSSITSIGNYFLINCSAFNQPLDISGITSIGTTFLGDCHAFNQPLDISGITSIGTTFLVNCHAFNQPLDLSNITSIDDRFLYSCSAFNQPLDLSGITSIGTNFLNYCSAFNQPLDLSNITSIGDNFLSYCSSFNQPLDLGNIISIGDRFLYGCNSFNRPLTIPSSITSISNYFIYYCSAFIHIIYNASVYPTDDYSLSQGIDTKTSVNGTGILVTGTHAADLKAALPDRTTSPYRKLVLE